MASAIKAKSSIISSICQKSLQFCWLPVATCHHKIISGDQSWCKITKRPAKPNKARRPKLQHYCESVLEIFLLGLPTIMHWYSPVMRLCRNINALPVILEILFGGHLWSWSSTSQCLLLCINIPRCYAAMLSTPILCTPMLCSHVMHSLYKISQDASQDVAAFIIARQSFKYLYLDCLLLCIYTARCYATICDAVPVIWVIYSWWSYYAFILPNVMHYLLFQLLSLPACLLCTQKKLWHISAWRLEAILNTIKMIFIGLKTRLIFNRV